MIGRLIDGRYQVRSRIARGGMATVYLATDLRLERRVAIKIMHGHLADDSQFKERFIQEARSAARLAHPNVVNVFDQGQDSDMAYLVMEYLPGITLRDLLQEHGKLTTEQTLDILEAVLSGLSAAHKAGIVHRDLKPENVLLADDGRIKLGDFGLARAVSANTATGAALLGTIAYLSPELVTRGVADARSDIYAVGIIMYEMLTGEQPFKGEQPMQIAYQHANDSVPTPSLKNPRVPAELDELVVWATAREPNDRPRDARVLLDQLLATQELLSTALPAGATGTQRTMVLPTAMPTPVGNTADTQILGGVPARHTTAPVVSDSTVALAEWSQKRRSRGWWLLGLVVLLAALSGGATWYLQAGPSTYAQVADVNGKTVAEATSALRANELVVAKDVKRETDPVVKKGLVLRTNPAVGKDVKKGSTVTLVVSDGPKAIKLPTLVGLPLEEAQKAVTDAGFTVSENAPSEQFTSKADKGVVIVALDRNGKDLEGRTTYSEQRAIGFIISAGSLPDVAGKTVDEAKAALSAVGLTGQTGEETYSDDVPKDHVISIDKEKVNGKSRTFMVGDTQPVLLTISRGPELVSIPDVLGKTWSEAKPILTDAGFVLDYNRIADVAPGLIRVQSVDPAGGQSAPKGSTLKVSF